MILQHSVTPLKASSIVNPQYKTANETIKDRLLIVHEPD